MSWLFGLNNKGAIGDAPQVPVLGDESGTSGENDSASVSPVSSNSVEDSGYRSEAYSFDSTALERAAKAAKVGNKFANYSSEGKQNPNSSPQLIILTGAYLTQY